MCGTCWICKKVGRLTGEHQLNRVDLADIFGTVTQAGPVYLQRDDQRNRPVRSLKSKLLKSSGTLCENCNSTLTQPYDRAFTNFRRSLVERLSASRAGDTFRLKKLVPRNTAQTMLGVHLHFAKKFGEYAVESGAPIDLSSFSDSLLHSRPHPYLHLKFGVGPLAHKHKFTGRTEMEIAHIVGRPADVRFATYMTGYDGLIVSAMYALTGEKCRGLTGAWHPSIGRTKTITIAQFKGADS